LTTRRVTAISNNLYKQSNAVLKGALNETNCSSDVGSCDSFLSKFFARSISCSKSFSLIQYVFANSFKSVLLIEMFELDLKELKFPKALLLNRPVNSWVSYTRRCEEFSERGSNFLN